MTKPIEGPLEGSQEWQDIHEKMLTIGASDAAKACNRSNYGTSLDLYLRAIGELPERQVDENAVRRMRRGRRLQSVILQEYGTEMNVEVRENNQMFYHADFPFCSATPDGIVLDTVQRLVESKASSPHMYTLANEDARYGEEGTDWVPDDVLFQAQQQMSVMDMDQCDVVVMFGVFLMRIYPIPRNDDLIDGIICAEQELMQRIADRNPPEPHWTHPRTKQLIQAISGLVPNSVRELSLDDANYWLERARIGDDIKKLEARKEECTNRLLWALGDAELGRFPQGAKELRRVVVQESLYTEDDVRAVEGKLGQVKRKKYERLLERKVK